mmetsp:Transcript_20137/g.34308  ORF Transcript_20137/g.34308 Transcript_20137/m.34308 type:complete len:277 (-) Transcript_20137:3544-4374(-)
MGSAGAEHTSYYEILGVPPTAEQSAIRKAYLKKSLKYHPDKNPGAEEEAKANFILIGQAYEVLGDPIKRAQYDRESQGGTFTFKRRQSQTNNYNNAHADKQADNDFDNFMNMFDETVAGMSEEELNMAMGAAAVVGGLLGSVMASRASKGNSLLSSAAQMVGSAVASRAASSLVQAVHTDSQQRVLEREEREAAIARGESVPEPVTRDRVFKDAKNTAQKVAEAAFGGASSSSNATTSYANNGRGGSGMSWGQAVKFAAMAAGAVAEMQRSSNQRR